jgi:hypothetical protein
LGLVALVTTFLLIGALAGPPSHVSATRVTIIAGVLGAESLVGLALVRRWPHSRRVAIASSFVGAVAAGAAALRLFADPGAPDPEGGAYRAAFGFAVFAISTAIVLIRNRRA